MSTARPHPRTGLLGGAALLLVLLGVLAMHGVGGHAAAHGPLPPSHAHDSVATRSVDHAVTETVRPLATDAPQPAWWTALCLAVLVGAVLLLSGRPGGAPGRLVTPRAASRTRIPGGRDRDPPSLVVLSVRRC